MQTLLANGNMSSHINGDELGNINKVSAALAVRTIDVGSITYVGQAAVGSATSAAVWQVQKIDSSSGTVVTWADGDELYDNVWDNYATLTYS